VGAFVVFFVVEVVAVWAADFYDFFDYFSFFHDGWGFCSGCLGWSFEQSIEVDYYGNNDENEDQREYYAEHEEK